MKCLFNLFVNTFFMAFLLVHLTCFSMEEKKNMLRKVGKQIEALSSDRGSNLLQVHQQPRQLHYQNDYYQLPKEEKIGCQNTIDSLVKAFLYKQKSELSTPEVLKNLKHQYKGNSSLYNMFQLIYKIIEITGSKNIKGLGENSTDQRQLFKELITRLDRNCDIYFIPESWEQQIITAIKKNLFEDLPIECKVYPCDSIVEAVAVIHDSNLIATGSRDGMIRLLKTDTGACIKILRGHASDISCISFNKDSSLIVSASWDQTIRLWNIRKKKREDVLTGHQALITSVAFNSGGDLIVSTSVDNIMRIWTVKNRAFAEIKINHEKPVTHVEFSPDSKQIITGSMDGTIKIFDVKKGICLQTLTGHTGWVNWATYNKDGSLLVSASNDKTIRIWNVKSGECLHVMEGHTDWVKSAIFSNEGTRIISSSWDGTIRIWDPDIGSCLGTLKGHSGVVGCVAISPDDIYVVSASTDKTIRVWTFKFEI